MKTLLRLTFSMFVGIVLIGPANASRSVQVSASGLGFKDIPVPTCAGAQELMGDNSGYGPWRGGTCAVSDGDMSNKFKAGQPFSTSYQKPAPYTGTLTFSFIFPGSCKAGTEVGSFKLFAGYTKTGVDDGEFIGPQPPVPGNWSYKGCIVALSGLGDCYIIPSEPEVSPGVSKTYCDYKFAETGELGGAAESGPAEQVPPYVPPDDGGTDTGGGDTGGGDTGGGDTGGGDTGGGDTGGGDTGGGDTGGGDTGGGDTGGGDTGGGDGTGDLCSKHPGLNICKNSSWSGSCGQITCTGDAIQCEILRQQAEARCEAKQDREVLANLRERLLGEQILGGNDPDKDKLPSKGNAEQIGLPSFDTSGWLGGGSCFEDKSFTIKGQTFTLPFSEACEYLVVFRYAFMVIASLISFKVLSGAILRD